MKKYALKNSYFKFKSANDPDTLPEIVSFFMEKGELPFNHHGENWVYDTMIERQKRKGVVNSQYLTPDKTAERIAELALMYIPCDKRVLDACCGTGQITSQLLKNDFIVEGFDADKDMAEVCKNLHPECNIYRMDFAEPADKNKRYDLVVANPPYEAKLMKTFFNWLSETLTHGGMAILLLPKNFIDKQNPKSLAETMSHFSCIHREPMNEQFALNNTIAEIVVLESKNMKQTTELIIHHQEAQMNTEPEIIEVEAEEVHETALTVYENQPAFPDVIQCVDILQIRVNPNNPRKFHKENELNDLATSIKNHGIIQPITIRPKNDFYEIVCGERRYRASMIAGLNTIPAIIKQYSDDDALEITIVENLQRMDITPIEEAHAFSQLMELRGYVIEDLCKQFGKSDKYIRTRLQLLNLIEDVALFVINDEISLVNALELSKYSHEIQTDVYYEHLNVDGFLCWCGLTANSFRDRLESNYAADLDRYDFDKTECVTCSNNSATFDLFAEGACGKCQNISCLLAKQKDHIIASTVALADKSENMEICIRPYAKVGETLVNEIKDMGFEITKDVRTNPFPQQPDAPVKEDFGTDEDFSMAQTKYDEEVTEYQTKVAELEKKVAEGKAVKMIDISNNNPTLCYREVEKVTVRDDKNTYTKLIEKDKRNKEIAKEKTIEDVKKFIRETTIPFSPFQPKEQDLLYFIMLKHPNSRHISNYGLKSSYPENEDIVEILPKLTEEQKALILRDFIVSNLTETWGVNKQSELLLDFVSLHYPQKVEELGKPYEDVYKKRHERIKERLKEFEKAANHLNNANQEDEPIESQTLPILAPVEGIEYIPGETDDVPKIGNEVPALTEEVLQVNKVELSEDDQLPQAAPDNSFILIIGNDVPIYEGTIEPAITEPLSEVA